MMEFSASFYGLLAWEILHNRWYDLNGSPQDPLAARECMETR